VSGAGPGRLLNGLGFDKELAFADFQAGQAPRLELALEDHPGEGVHEGLLDEAFEGAGPEMGVEAAGPAP